MGTARSLRPDHGRESIQAGQGHVGHRRRVHLRHCRTNHHHAIQLPIRHRPSSHDARFREACCRASLQQRHQLLLQGDAKRGLRWYVQGSGPRALPRHWRPSGADCIRPYQAHYWLVRRLYKTCARRLCKTFVQDLYNMCAGPVSCSPEQSNRREPIRGVSSTTFDYIALSLKSAPTGLSYVTVAMPLLGINTQTSVASAWFSSLDGNLLPTSSKDGDQRT